MTLNRLVCKTHKWLAVGTGFFTFLWFASGVVMLLPSSFLKTASPSSLTAGSSWAEPSFREVKVSVGEAIGAAETVTSRQLEVTGVKFRRLLGRLLYEISTADGGTYLIDALSGERLVVTESLARRIAAGVIGDPNSLREMLLIRTYDAVYKFGPLPAYRVVVGDSRGGVVHVVLATGEVSYSNRLGRVRTALAGLHFLDFLRPHLPDRWVRAIMLGFSVLGALMSVFGAWILWLQFKAWRAARGSV